MTVTASDSDTVVVVSGDTVVFTVSVVLKSFAVSNEVFEEFVVFETFESDAVFFISLCFVTLKEREKVYHIQK